MSKYLQILVSFPVVAFLLLFGNTRAESQVYLYLEDMTQVSAIKIPQGSRISIKTKDNSEWTTYRMNRLLPDVGVILHDRGMLDLVDVTHIRLERTWVKALAYSLQGFGTAWGIYGAIILAVGNETTTLAIVLIGSLVPIGVGKLMNKLWRYKHYKIGKKNRLKILDLSFPDDPYGVKEKRVMYYP